MTISLKSHSYSYFKNWEQDHIKGDWWFAINDEDVGYWPASLFKSWRESNAASYASWGGQVYSPVTKKSPPMGSGHWPSEGFQKSAYVSHLQMILGDGRVFNPQTGTVKLYQTNQNCYKARLVHEVYKPWLKSIYYGGPGGCIG